jgi:hypothetical protein
VGYAVLPATCYRWASGSEVRYVYFRWAARVVLSYGYSSHQCRCQCRRHQKLPRILTIPEPPTHFLFCPIATTSFMHHSLSSSCIILKSSLLTSGPFPVTCPAPILGTPHLRRDLPDPSVLRISRTQKLTYNPNPAGFLPGD